MSEYTVIRQMDEKYAPPDQPVLMVAVIGNITYLEIATLEESPERLPEIPGQEAFSV